MDTANDGNYIIYKYFIIFIIIITTKHALTTWLIDVNSRFNSTNNNGQWNINIGRRAILIALIYYKRAKVLVQTYGCININIW